MGRHTWRCHKDTGHGEQSLRGAIKYSCDTYFYTMGARIGIDAMGGIARLFGFGERSGVALQNEKTGLVPDEAFHDRVDATTGGYQRGMAVNAAIGQGSVLVTPMQLALAYAAIANGGQLYTPQYVARIETADFRVVRRVAPQEGSPDAVPADEVGGSPPVVLAELVAKLRRTVDIAPQDLASLREGLVAVTSEPGGTAYWRRSRLVPMAGKTGTSQVVRLGKDRIDTDELAYEERDHAWFVAYAPPEAPQIVVAVVNEHSGHGGSKAAPIAVDVIDAYFQGVVERQAGVASTAGEGP
jgi:penicillin-binding protein 2